MISVEGLSKVFRVRRRGHGVLGSLFFPRFESFTAVDNVSFDVGEGEILGLLGPNGAGKTTIIKIICSLLEPTSGRVLVDGAPPGERKGEIGLVLGPAMVYRRMTGYDNLRYYGELYGVGNIDARIRELCGFLGISGWLDEYVEHYSSGMVSKLAVARALIHDPKVLVLDEPTLGLDVRMAEEIRGRILKLDKTILLTTHYMEEAKVLSDRVVLLNRGRVAKVIEDPKRVDIREEFLHESA